VRLLEIAAQVATLLSKESVEEYDKLKELCESYLALVEDLQVTLNAQIRGAPTTRNYRASAYDQLMHLRLSSPQLDVIRAIASHHQTPSTSAEHPS
jgi:hypothetical protein